MDKQTGSKNFIYVVSDENGKEIAQFNELKYVTLFSAALKLYEAIDSILAEAEGK